MYLWVIRGISICNTPGPFSPLAPSLISSSLYLYLHLPNPSNLSAPLPSPSQASDTIPTIDDHHLTAMSARVVNATAKIKQSSLIFSRLLKKTVVVYLVDLSNTTPPTSVTSAALLADGRFKRHPDRSWITFGGPTSAYPMGENMTVVLDKLGKACKRHYSHEIRLEMAKVINKHTKIPGCIIVDALDRREHSLLAV